MTETAPNRIECLDGLRGIAALWVLIGHAHLLTRFRVPLIGDPDLGVDLFIVLSGFLMVFHYRLREAKEPWELPSTWRTFWLRRFFRIAPLYYIMLIFAIALGPAIYEARVMIDAYNSVPVQPAGRYLDQSFWNWVAHLTFAFGTMPGYAYRTALPDWSIGLEMQFYLVLPFVMLVIKRLNLFVGIGAVVFAGLAAAVISYALGYRFPMPAFLPLKMHVFAVGILMASVLGADAKRVWLAAALSAALMLIPIGGAMGVIHHGARLAIVGVFFLLLHHRVVWQPLRPLLSKISSLLGNKFFHLLGELSFGAYLAHLLVMQPVIAYLIANHPMSNPARWATALAITVPVTYLIAAIGYRWIEIPGQALGKALTRKRAMAAA